MRHCARHRLALLAPALLVLPGCVMDPALHAPPECRRILDGQVDVPKYWIDSSGDEQRISVVERHGLTLVSRFHSDTPMICDHRDTTGVKTTTYDDFRVNVHSGVEGACALTGEINACRYDNPNPEVNGPVWVPFEAEVVDGPRIVGIGGPDPITGGKVEVEYIALDCLPKPASVWFDTPDPESIRYRTVYDPLNHSVEHTAIDDFQNAQTVSVLPTVHGTVRSAGVSPFRPTIEIVVDDTGNHLLIALLGESSAPTRPYVGPGDPVVPDRPVAELGPRPDNREEFAIHLSARTPDGRPINPDCVEVIDRGDIQRRPEGMDRMQ